MNKNVLGIDIGGTSIKIGVVNNNEVIVSSSMRNLFKGNPETLIPGIKDICNDYISKYNIKDIGVGCPGDIDNGVVIFASNLGWKNFDLLNAFAKEFPNLNIVIDNDGNAACQAEINDGHLKDVNNGLFVTIGKGIGGAIILDNRIIKGNHNKGGRFGHTVIHTNGRKCNCGRRGCFERYASVTGLIQTVKEFNLKWKVEEEKIDVEKLSGYQIVKYSKESNNKMIKEALNKWHNDIAEGLLDLCHVIDPSVIVIAGGITESGLLDINYIQEFLVNHNYGDCIVKLAKNKGKTGLVGAANLIK